MTRRLPALAIAAFLGLAVIGAGGPALSGDEPLIRNGAMEAPNKDTGVPRDWSTWLWEGQGDVSVKPAREGGKGVAVLSNTGIGKQALIQEVPLKRCFYTLSALVAGQDMVPGTWGQTGHVLIEFADKRSHIFELLVAGGDHDWRRVSFSFFVPVDLKATVYFFNYGSGRLFVDDVELMADPQCREAPDRVAAAAPTGERLTFKAPHTAADDLLTGYCGDALYAAGPVCTARETAGPGGGETVPKVAAGPALPRAPLVIAGKGSRVGRFSDGHYLALAAPGELAEDWRGYDVLRFEIGNESGAAQQIGIEIWDAKTKGYWSRVNWTTFAAAGTSSVEIPLQIFVGEKSVIKERRRLDLGGIRRLVFTTTGAPLTVSAIELVQVAGFTSLFPELIRLDAGPPEGPVLEGFTPLLTSTGYRIERGYGFVPETKFGAPMDRRHPDDLFRDWVSILSGGLDFDLPNGRYHVWMMLEDPGYWEYYPSFRGRSVFAQGKLILDDKRSAADFFARYYSHENDEDLPGDDIWQRYIKTRYRPLEATVEVTNGTLSLRFASGGNPLAVTLSALIIYPEAKAEAGARFLDELWAKLRTDFNREYRQMIPAAPREPPRPPNALGGRLSVFTRSAATGIAAGDWAAPGELVAGFQVPLARGQIAPLTVGLRAEEDLKLTGASLAIAGFSTEAYWVRNKVSRVTQDGTIYANIPRLLDPLAPSPARPLILARGKSRQLWFDIEALPATQSGQYHGTLTLTFEGYGPAEFPIDAELYPWSLPKADIPVGYLGSATNYPHTSYPEVEAKRLREFGEGLDLLARYGMTAVSGGLGGPQLRGFEGGRPLLDFRLADASMTGIAARFSGPVLSYDGLSIDGLSLYRPEVPDGAGKLPYGFVVRDVVAHVRAHGAAHGWPELVFAIGDEPDDEALPGTLVVARAIRASGTGAKTAIFTTMDDKASAAKLSIAGLIDHVLLNGHSERAIRQIVSQGSTCSLYNHRNRFQRGIYLMKLRALGCGGHYQFAYNSVHVDPWYDLDGREDDQVAVFTHSDGRLRRALDFMRYREAITDYRTLLALRRAIDDNPGLASSKAAAGWFDELMGGITVGGEPGARWSDAALDRVRQEANAHLVSMTSEHAQKAR